MLDAAVCAGGNVEAYEVLDLISQLVDRSIAYRSGVDAMEALHGQEVVGLLRTALVLPRAEPDEFLAGCLISYGTLTKREGVALEEARTALSVVCAQAVFVLIGSHPKGMRRWSSG